MKPKQSRLSLPVSLFIVNSKQLSELKDVLQKPDRNFQPKDFDLLINLFHSVDYFKDYDENTLKFIAQKIQVQKYPEGTRIFNKGKLQLYRLGDQAENIYFVLEGVVKEVISKKEEITQKEHDFYLTQADHSYCTFRREEILEMNPGKYFGLRAFIENTDRKTRAEAKQQCVLAQLSKFHFFQAVNKLEQRKQDQMIEFLSKVSIFKNLSRNAIKKVMKNMVSKECIKGQVILQEGQTIKYIYVVKEGEIKFEKKMKQSENKNEKNITLCKDILNEKGQMNSLKIRRTLQNLHNQTTQAQVEKRSTLIQLQGPGTVIGDESLLQFKAKCTSTSHSIKSSLLQFRLSDIQSKLEQGGGSKETTKVIATNVYSKDLNCYKRSKEIGEIEKLKKDIQRQLSKQRNRIRQALPPLDGTKEIHEYLKEKQKQKEKQIRQEEQSKSNVSIDQDFSHDAGRSTMFAGFQSSRSRMANNASVCESHRVDPMNRTLMSYTQRHNTSFDTVSSINRKPSKILKVKRNIQRTLNPLSSMAGFVSPPPPPFQDYSSRISQGRLSPYLSKLKHQI